MLRAVIFDLDNTLLDFMGLKNKSCEAAIDAMIKAGLGIEKERALRILFELYSRYGIEHGRIFQKFLARLGRKDMKILSAAIVAYRRVQAQERKPYKGVKEVLSALRKKYRLGVISDAPSIKAWTRLTELGLVDFFDVVITYDDTKRKKPHPLPYRMALQALGLKPEEILFIGDAPHRDIKGARLAGMKTCLAEYGLQDSYAKEKGKYKADYVAKNVKDILKIVDSI